MREVEVVREGADGLRREAWRFTVDDGVPKLATYTRSERRVDGGWTHNTYSVEPGLCSISAPSDVVEEARRALATTASMREVKDPLEDTAGVSRAVARSGAGARVETRDIPPRAGHIVGVLEDEMADGGWLAVIRWPPNERGHVRWTVADALDFAGPEPRYRVAPSASEASRDEVPAAAGSGA